ncbi:hypothetical protein [Planomonospora algeriensis]
MSLKRTALTIVAAVAALTAMGGAASATSTSTTASTAFAQAAGDPTVTNAGNVQSANFPGVIGQVLWQVVAIQVVDAANGCHTKGNMCFDGREAPDMKALD